MLAIGALATSFYNLHVFVLSQENSGDIYFRDIFLVKEK